jgi:2-keto-4-pentenoate hydratase/2-oxohepta-3-ene-1,7-dioic acid hydratase in catechol pathway
MILKVPEMIEYISKYMTLNEGDLLFTGTPAGAGSVQVGDRLVGTLSSKEGK